MTAFLPLTLFLPPFIWIWEKTALKPDSDAFSLCLTLSMDWSHQFEDLLSTSLNQISKLHFGHYFSHSLRSLLQPLIWINWRDFLKTHTMRTLLLMMACQILTQYFHRSIANKAGLILWMWLFCHLWARSWADFYHLYDSKDCSYLYLAGRGFGLN